jgi:ubiquinone/menaquinone biosynthesis C-methylase UbiE
MGNKLKILDCGAGGQVPPLALFNEHGFETYGLDISDQQLERAGKYCQKMGIRVNFHKADMRHIPFSDGSYDCVYEHYAMCHLSKRDTETAIHEMRRVTTSQGLCFLGVISMDSGPKSLYGEEAQPGEFWMEGERHSMFTDVEADVLVNGWEILSKEKRVIYLRGAAQQISQDDWMEMAASEDAGWEEDDWRVQYHHRENIVNYTHLYYILRKR